MVGINYQLDCTPEYLAGTPTPGNGRTAITKHAIPFFGADKDIRKFRKAELLAFQKSLTLSDKGKFNVIGALKSMLRWAYGYEEIKTVPRRELTKTGDIRNPDLTPVAKEIIERQRHLGEFLLCAPTVNRTRIKT